MSDNNLPDSDKFVLILSVGGSPEPLIQSINHFKPRYVIFIASTGSSEKVKEVLQNYDQNLTHQIIVLSDHENLIDCVKDIRREIPEKLKFMGLPSDILLIADITGGTKVMSAALALVMMEFNSLFSYVGGSQRSKDGLGPVTGQGKIIQTANPWDAIGLREARELVKAFNSSQYEDAREKALFLASKDVEYKKFYNDLALLISAFHHWDIFNYARAASDFKQALGRLDSYNNRGHENFRVLYKQLQEAFSALEKVAEDAKVLRSNKPGIPAEKGRAYINDLLANARRCARRGRYDDAVARLYSVVEKTAKIKLAHKGLNNSKISCEMLAEICPEIAAKYGSEAEYIRLPLQDSYSVVCSMAPDDPVAQAYKNNDERLHNLLEARNLSLLAHGYNPVQSEEYEKLFNIVQEFLRIEENELLEFPVFDVKSILFD